MIARRLARNGRVIVEMDSAEVCYQQSNHRHLDQR
jgi:hypothetical protein